MSSKVAVTRPTGIAAMSLGRKRSECIESRARPSSGIAFLGRAVKSQQRQQRSQGSLGVLGFPDRPGGQHAGAGQLGAEQHVEPHGRDFGDFGHFASSDASGQHQTHGAASATLHRNARNRHTRQPITCHPTSGPRTDQAGRSLPIHYSRGLTRLIRNVGLAASKRRVSSWGTPRLSWISDTVTLPASNIRVS